MKAGGNAVVSHGDRVRDRIALALIAAGVAMYGYGLIGMRGLTDNTLRTFVGGSARLEYAVRWWTAHAGIVFTVAGVALAIASFVIHARRPRG